MHDMFIRCICAHLSPGSEWSLYKESVEDIDQLCAGLPEGGHLVIGADVQDSLSIIDNNIRLHEEYVGAFAEGPAGRKSREFVNMMLAHNIFAANTFNQQPSRAITT